MIHLKEGFPPIARKDARVLILGSMPGEESLRRKEYYGNPRNAFWKIMARIFEFDPLLDYEKKIGVLTENSVALWDVLKTCERFGSLDTNIKTGTIIKNNFVDFYRRFPCIRNVFFNGSRAEHEYQKRVMPEISAMPHCLIHKRLPSTSPAMSRLSFAEKLLEWSEIKIVLRN